MIKTNIAYAIGSAANSAALFILIPYLINVLPPAAYGAWTMHGIILLILVMIMTASMDVGLMREYWLIDNDEGKRRLVGTIFSAVTNWGLFVSLFISSIGFLVGVQNITWLNEYGGLRSLFILVFIGLIDSLFMITLAILRIHENAIAFVVLSTGKLFVLVVSVIIGVQLLGGVEGALVGRLVASILPLGAALWVVRTRMTLSFDVPELRRVLRYSLPLLPTGLALYILFSLDRFMIESMISLEMAAVYTFASKIAATLDMLVTRPFALDWGARRFKIAKQSNAEHLYTDGLLLYLFSAGSGALFILAGSPFAYLWIAPPIYAQGSAAVPVILLAYIIYGLSIPLNIGLMLRDKTVYMPIIGLVSIVICILFNLWWIPEFGLLGAAWATVVSYSVWTGSVTVCSFYFSPIHYPLPKVFILLASISMGFIGLLFMENLWQVEHTPFLNLGLSLLWVSVICIIMAKTTFDLKHIRSIKWVNHLFIRS